MAETSKKVFKVFFVTLVVLCSAAGAWITYKITNARDDFHFKPSVSVAGVSVEDMEESHLRVFPTLRIINDLNLEANVRELAYELTHDNDRVLTSLVKKTFTIKKQDTSEITLAMRLNKVDLERLNRKVESTHADSSMFRLRLSFRLDVPVRGIREFELTRDLDLPLLRPIEVESRELSLEKFSLKHPELKMKLNLRNKNTFPVVLDNCEIGLVVGDDLTLKGRANGVQRLDARSTREVVFDLRVDDIKPLEFAWKSVFRDKKTPFRSELSFQVISSNETLNRSRFVIVKTGKLSELNRD